jgi:hypothetical protein
MIAAMAAAVSAVSTLRSVSGAAGLSANAALVEGVGPPEAFWAVVNDPLKATGCANADGKKLTGALWRPTEQAPNAINPKRTNTALTLIGSVQPQHRTARKLCEAAATAIVFLNVTTRAKRARDELQPSSCLLKNSVAVVQNKGLGTVPSRRLTQKKVNPCR